MGRDGSTVVLGSGRRANVAELLGEGGQGAVFAVDVDDGRRLALKRYHQHVATDHQFAAIAELIERGRPNERFLWPLELAFVDGRAIGYVMDVRPPEFVGLGALLNGKVDTSLRTVCSIGHQLADSFLMLHAQGLCYRDISFGNVFFDPLTGQTLVCDTDNVGLDGAPAGVMGTKRFMAPEIVRREARPGTDSDLYSLAVLLFYLLMIGHPLLGARELEFAVWDERAELALFGERPLFVFDPSDDSNRPVAGVHDAVISNWPIYPTALRAVFVTAFTAGLHDPRNGRVRESQWRSEMVKARDLLFACGRCAAVNFLDVAMPTRRCWHCQDRLHAPVGMRFPGGTVVLERDTQLTAHHVNLGAYDFDTVVAKVVAHPTRPGTWGLLNTSADRWDVELADGRRLEVEPGRTVGMIDGTTIRFGRVNGRIEQAVGQ